MRDLAENYTVCVDNDGIEQNEELVSDIINQFQLIEQQINKVNQDLGQLDMQRLNTDSKNDVARTF